MSAFDEQQNPTRDLPNATLAYGDNCKAPQGETLDPIAKRDAAGELQEIPVTGGAETTYPTEKEGEGIPGPLLLQEDDCKSENTESADGRSDDERALRYNDVTENIRKRAKVQAPKRIQQFSQYLRIMENRLAFLESAFEDAKFQKAKPSCDSESTGNTSIEGENPINDSGPIVGIGRFDIDTFHILIHRETLVHTQGNDDTHPYVYFNLSKPHVRAEVRAQARKNRSQSEKEDISRRHIIELSFANIQRRENSKIPQVPIRAKVSQEMLEEDSFREAFTEEMELQDLERIRIRSFYLLEELDAIGGKLGEIEPTTTVAFTHPYKFLCSSEDKIRQRLADLEVAFAAQEAKAEGSPSVQAFIVESDDTAKEKYGTDPPNTDIKKRISHMRVLVELLDTDLKPILDLRKELLSGERKTIAFRDLWHLFKHGDELRCPSQGCNFQIYRTWDFTGGREIAGTSSVSVPEWCMEVEKARPGSFKVEGLHYRFNGKEFMSSFELFFIDRYEGEKDIKSLPIYPLRFDEDWESAQGALLERSKRFLSLVSVRQATHREYSGLSLDSHPQEIESQVIVDNYLAFLHNPQWLVNPSPAILRHDPRELFNYDFWVEFGGLEANRSPIRDIFSLDYVLDAIRADNAHMAQPLIKSTEDPSDWKPADILLLPAYIHGFVLRSRKWATFNIDLLTDVKYTSNFDDLVLRDGHKEKVLALVKSHIQGKKPTKEKHNHYGSMDIVKGKGKGLIILLHGEPGVGKTSTAECVADYIQRPLFPITCGDLGENASEVEDRLERNFQMAHRWGCVLLLDEADVFLAQRTKFELQRNVIVSVFLRTLEYYSGILFLTTNRVGALDPAFKSRIHLSLYYPRLDRETTVKIWRMHIKRAKRLYASDMKPFKVRSSEILDFARSHYDELDRKKIGSWNGRQIRNAFQTAVALAEYKAQSGAAEVKLTDKEFSDVAKASQEFDDYLFETLRFTEAEVAQKNAYRAANYDHNDRRKHLNSNIVEGRKRSVINSARTYDYSESPKPGRRVRRLPEFDSEPETDTDSESDQKMDALDSLNSENERDSVPEREDEKNSESSDDSMDSVSHSDTGRKKRKGKDLTNLGASKVKSKISKERSGVKSEEQSKFSGKHKGASLESKANQKTSKKSRS